MLCNAPRLVDQLHYYLAYFDATDRGRAHRIEISINRGVVTLLTPEIHLSPGQSLDLDFQPVPLTEPQTRLLSWLAQVLHILSEDRVEGKLILLIDPARGRDPYDLLLRLHRPLNGKVRP